MIHHKLDIWHWKRPGIWFVVIFVVSFLFQDMFMYPSLQKQWEGAWPWFFTSWFSSLHFLDVFCNVLIILICSWGFHNRFLSTQREWFFWLWAIVAGGQVSLSILAQGVVGFSTLIGASLSFSLLTRKWIPLRRPIFIGLMMSVWYLQQSLHSETEQVYGFFAFLVGTLVGASWVLFRVLLRDQKYLEWLLGILMLFLFSISIAEPFSDRYWLWGVNKQWQENPVFVENNVNEILAEASETNLFLLAEKSLTKDFASWDALSFLDSKKDFVLAKEILSHHYMGVYQKDSVNYSKALHWIEKLPQGYEKQNMFSMLYCGARDSTFWNIDEGIRLAESLNNKTSWNIPAFLDTYVSCLAQKGDWKQAISLQESAIEQTVVVEQKAILQQNLSRLKSQSLIFYP